MKTCSKCGVPKEESEFHKCSANLDGLQGWCKTCVKEGMRTDYQENPEKYKQKTRTARQKNPDGINAAQRGYARSNRAAINKRRRERYQKDPKFRASILLRIRLRDALLVSGVAKTTSALKLLGCPVVWLEAYLEEQFVPGMTWKNHGEVWEIDHIKPCAKFDLTDPEQQRICFHWTNLQPLSVLENRIKRDIY